VRADFTGREILRTKCRILKLVVNVPYIYSRQLKALRLLYAFEESVDYALLSLLFFGYNESSPITTLLRRSLQNFYILRAFEFSCNDFGDIVTSSLAKMCNLFMTASPNRGPHATKLKDLYRPVERYVVVYIQYLWQPVLILIFLNLCFWCSVSQCHFITPGLRTGRLSCVH